MVKEIYGLKKVLWHHDKMDSFREERVTAPIQVRVKPTNRCNHYCYYCAYDINAPENTRIDRKVQLPYEKIIELLDNFRDMGVKSVTYSGGGEPLIYPHILEILEKTLDYGIELSMITNGQKLEGRVADLLKQAKWVRVSLDSCDAKTFKETRKVPEKWFYELIDNLKNFVANKSKGCILGINFVVQEKNFNKIYDSIKFFREVGIDNIKLTPRYIPEYAKEYHNKFKKTVREQIVKARKDFLDFKIYDTYQIDFDSVGVPERKYFRCYFMQMVPAISAKGDVYPCHDKAWIGIDSLGSIINQSFKELWFSKEVAKKFKEFNPKIMCRHHCTNDLKNIEIKNYLDSYGDHINFP